MKKLLLVSAVLMLVAGSVPVSATSYVMMRDGVMADTSPIVVQGTVVASAPSPASGTPSTDYIVHVERLLKGTVSGSAVVVRVPGGVGPDGIGFEVYGAPSFQPGERSILFLNPGPDGTYRVRHLMLGAFHSSTQRGVDMALRDLSQAQQIGKDPYAESDRPRHFDRFADWINDRAEGRVRGADYFVRDSDLSLRSAGQRFTLIREAGKRTRWFEFDTGGSVNWFMHQDGYNGAGNGGRQFREALAVWNDDPGTNINMVYGGKTGATQGFSNFDDVNAILFEDPNNDVGSTFSCASGGVLAIGGPWFDVDTRMEWLGRTYIKILGADVVTGRGTQCYFANNPERRAEVWAHEIGHALGISHSCGDDSSPACNTAARDDALMRAFAHDDGRGAVLGEDDIAAANRLYGDGTGGGGGGGGGPTGSLDAPSNLRANRRSDTEIRLRWEDNSSDESSFVIFRQLDGGGFKNFMSTAGDTTLLILSGLEPGTHEFRVRAKGGGARSEFSNIDAVTLP